LPGLKYEHLGEYFETSGLGRWYSYNHVLQAAFVQSKIVFNSRFKSGEIIYTGVNLGSYFWSFLKDRDNPEKAISEYRRAELNRFLLGIVLGARIKKTGRLRPALEVQYQPNYGEFNDIEKNALSISFILGINAKKELPE
ncbi:MAG: hypothetical protein ACOC11_01440, partial [Prolixibacteraceae bacterium]